MAPVLKGIRTCFRTIRDFVEHTLSFGLLDSSKNQRRIPELDSLIFGKGSLLDRFIKGGSVVGNQVASYAIGSKHKYLK